MSSKNRKQTGERRKHDLSQFGIFDVPNMDFENAGDSSGGDSDLEAELAALTSGGGKAKPKPTPKTVVPQSDLDKMIADSLRDIGSDEELSGDDDDPDLLNELSEITGGEVHEEIEEIPISPGSAEEQIEGHEQSSIPAGPILPTTTLTIVDTISTRIEMYKQAEKMAKDGGDSGRARRFNRGLKTLESLLKQAKTGKPINNDDIPPEVSVKSAQPTPATTASTEGAEPVAPVEPAPISIPPNVPSPPKIASPITSPNKNADKIDVIKARQKEYKDAALTSKKSGDKEKALQYIRVAKLFEKVLQMAEQGQEIDLSDMPPGPSEMPDEMLKAICQVSQPEPAKENENMQKSTEPETPKPAAVAPPPPAATTPSAPPPIPRTILEALTQRLELYQSREAAAKEANDSRKSRQNGRIVKQYQDAIKAHKAGRPIAFDELPDLPGYPPIPMGNTPAAAPTPRPAAPKATQEDDSPESSPSPQRPSPTRPALQKQESRISGNHSATTFMNKTIELLLERQKEFKQAALEAKQAGEIEQAKEYLKTFKGLENLLDVARGGLPVDLSSLPISPKQQENLAGSIESLPDSEVAPGLSENMQDVFEKIEEQLIGQLKKCKELSEHHHSLGDVVSKNRFDNLAVGVQKDLDLVKLAHRRGKGVPRFNVEQKKFHVIKCNFDLAETELEINVVRGIAYHVSKPKDIDTYVRVEFAYPQETPYKNKTAVIYDTDNPEYNEKFVAEYQPKNRNCQRYFKRYGVKFEVYSKGGFFRSDTLIGTATVKLQPLETACEIHDSFDLMEGRRQVGGKLEVKIRIRNPILQKQIVTETEKWLSLS